MEKNLYTVCKLNSLGCTQDVDGEEVEAIRVNLCGIGLDVYPYEIAHFIPMFKHPEHAYALLKSMEEYSGEDCEYRVARYEANAILGAIEHVFTDEEQAELDEEFRSECLVQEKIGLEDME